MLNTWRKFMAWAERPLLDWWTERSVRSLGRDIEAYQRLMSEHPNHKGPLPRGYR